MLLANQKIVRNETFPKWMQSMVKDGILLLMESF